MQIDYSYFNPYLLFLMGAIVLYFSSNLIISSSLSLSERYNVSKITVGVIALALGTSLPELFVSILAVIKGNEKIVIGNIIGSNIANIGLVLGMCVIIKPIILKDKKNISFNIISLFIITFIFLLFLFNNDLLKIESSILFVLLFLYLFFLIKYFSKEIQSFEVKNTNVSKTFLFLAIGFILIYFGSDFFINGALGIAYNLGLSDLMIGMTIIAIGTSCPELFTTFAAIKKNEYQLALGNIIGSNIINIVVVGGFLSFIKDIQIQFDGIIIHSFILLFLTLLFVFSILVLQKISRLLGLVFISIYFLFIFINF